MVGFGVRAAGVEDAAPVPVFVKRGLNASCRIAPENFAPGRSKSLAFAGLDAGALFI